MHRVMSPARHADEGEGASALAQRIAAGDTAAFDRFVADNWSAVAAYADRLLDDSFAAADVAQQSFIRLWERRRELSNVGSLRAYVFRIARNLSIDELRRRGLRHDTSSELGHDPAETVIDNAVQEQELFAIADRAIQRLSLAAGKSSR
jgi:RNA polymerase sigma factor (sigma-70 family)